MAKKRESEIGMQARHLNEVIDTVGLKYDDVVNGAFGVVLLAMITGRCRDMDIVAEDIRTLANHYIERVLKMKATIEEESQGPRAH